jgi:N6-L-threonylcarbamoyladenine synthase
VRKFTIHLSSNHFNKIEKAALNYNLKQIVIGGGVAANSELRKQLDLKAKKRDWEVFHPPLSYTTDNAAMIGIAAYYKLQEKQSGNLSNSAQARLKM